MKQEIKAIESAIREKDIEIMMDFRKVKADCQRFLDEARTITDNTSGHMERAILELKFKIKGHIRAFLHDVFMNDVLKSAIDAIHIATDVARRDAYLRDVSALVTCRLPEEEQREENSGEQNENKNRQ